MHRRGGGQQPAARGGSGTDIQPPARVGDIVSVLLCDPPHAVRGNVQGSGAGDRTLQRYCSKPQAGSKASPSPLLPRLWTLSLLPVFSEGSSLRLYRNHLRMYQACTFFPNNPGTSPTHCCHHPTSATVYHVGFQIQPRSCDFYSCLSERE